MAEAAPLAGSTDVALFIDWENMRGCIRGKANISALREVAESYLNDLSKHQVERIDYEFRAQPA